MLTKSFFSSSAIRQAHFEEVQIKKYGIKDGQVVKLQNLSVTRWSRRIDSINSTKRAYCPLIDCLSEISTSSSYDELDRSIASGIKAKITKLEFKANLAIFEDLLTLTNRVSLSFQKENIDFYSAVQLLEATKESLEERKNEKYFEKIWTEKILSTDSTASTTTATEESTNVSKKKRKLPELNTSSREKRRKRQSTRLDNFDVQSTIGQREELHEKNNIREKIQIKLVDLFIQEMNNRFETSNVNFLQSFSVINPNDKQFLDYETAKPLIQHYSHHFDQDHEKIEQDFELAKNAFKTRINDLNKIPANEKNLRPNQPIHNFLTEITKVKLNYPNVFKLTQIVLTLPISSASCERKFSTMRRVKNYLRNSCGDERLSNLIVISSERDLSQKLDLDKFINIFKSRKNRRMLFN